MIKEWLRQSWLDPYGLDLDVLDRLDDAGNRRLYIVLKFVQGVVKSLLNYMLLQSLLSVLSGVA